MLYCDDDIKKEHCMKELNNRPELGEGHPEGQEQKGVEEVQLRGFH